MKTRTFQQLVFYAVALASLASIAACDQSTAPDAEPDARKSVDLIVGGDYVVTMDESLSVYENAAVVIDDGVIVAIEPGDAVDAQYAASEVLD